MTRSTGGPVSNTSYGLASAAAVRRGALTISTTHGRPNVAPSGSATLAVTTPVADSISRQHAVGELLAGAAPSAQQARFARSHAAVSVSLDGAAVSLAAHAGQCFGASLAGAIGFDEAWSRSTAAPPATWPPQKSLNPPSAQKQLVEGRLAQRARGIIPQNVDVRSVRRAFRMAIERCAMTCAGRRRYAITVGAKRCAGQSKIRTQPRRGPAPLPCFYVSHAWFGRPKRTSTIQKKAGGACRMPGQRLRRPGRFAGNRLLMFS